jgi:hypothetical protein
MIDAMEAILTYPTEPPLPPPQGQRSVVFARLLRFKGTLGIGSVELFERLSLHRQPLSGRDGSQKHLDVGPVTSMGFNRILTKQWHDHEQ